MKRVLLFAVAVLVISPVMMSWKKTTPPPAAPAEEIHWMTSIDELQAKMAQHPKKVFVDVYTGWCGWCKKMDATTFKNASLVQYVNNNFYALRLDAERQDTIHFMGKTYYFDAAHKCNTFAVELLKGSMSYPTSVVMLENFQSPNPIPGYHDVPEMETILSYFGDNAFKHQKWEDYQKGFKPVWAASAAAPGRAN